MWIQSNFQAKQDTTSVNIKSPNLEISSFRYPAYQKRT